MAGNIVETNESNFQETIDQDKLVLVDFWAPWCGPCRRVAPILEEISNEMPDKVTIAKLNTDENPGISSSFGVMSIPTLMLFRKGERVDMLIGAHPKENIVAAISKHT